MFSEVSKKVLKSSESSEVIFSLFVNCSILYIHIFYNIQACFVFKVDVREDEEQTVKLEEIIEMLVSAGYYRARIKGLANFDKVCV